MNEIRVNTKLFNSSMCKCSYTSLVCYYFDCVHTFVSLSLSLFRVWFFRFLIFTLASICHFAIKFYLYTLVFSINYRTIRSERLTFNFRLSSAEWAIGFDDIIDIKEQCSIPRLTSADHSNLQNTQTDGFDKTNSLTQYDELQPINIYWVSVQSLYVCWTWQ